MTAFYKDNRNRETRLTKETYLTGQTGLRKTEWLGNRTHTAPKKEREPPNINHTFSRREYITVLSLFPSVRPKDGTTEIKICFLHQPQTAEKHKLGRDIPIKSARGEKLPARSLHLWLYNGVKREA